MKPLVISDPVLVLALQDEIRRSEEARYDHRLHGVLLVTQGVSAREVARLLGDSARAVQYWVQRFEKDGFSGLVEGERAGRPRRLSDRQLAHVERVLRKSPRSVGIPANLWDGKLLSHYLKEKYEMELGVRQCQRMFHRLGFRLRKPRGMIAHGNQEEREIFKKKGS